MAYKERDLGFTTQMIRGFLIFLNVIFVLASIAGIVASVLILKGDGHSFTKFCSICSKFSIVLIVAFSSLCFVSLLGCVGLVKRQNCLLLVYSMFLSLFFLVALAASIVVVLVQQGEFDSELHDAWDDSVRDDPSGICDLQFQVGCSGWESLCNFTNATSSCPDCSSNPSQSVAIMNATRTCKLVLKNDVNKYFVILVSTGFGLTLLTFISIVTACSVRRNYNEYEELSERF